jgi:hypothetical protein
MGQTGPTGPKGETGPAGASTTSTSFINLYASELQLDNSSGQVFLSSKGSNGSKLSAGVVINDGGTYVKANSDGYYRVTYGAVSTSPYACDFWLIKNRNNTVDGSLSKLGAERSVILHMSQNDTVQLKAMDIQTMRSCDAFAFNATNISLGGVFMSVTHITEEDPVQ